MQSATFFNTLHFILAQMGTRDPLHALEGVPRALSALLLTGEHRGRLESTQGERRPERLR